MFILDFGTFPQFAIILWYFLKNNTPSASALDGIVFDKIQGIVF